MYIVTCVRAGSMCNVESPAIMNISIFQNSEFEFSNVELQWHCNKAHDTKITQIVHIIVLLTVQKCRAVYCKLQ